MIIGGGYPKTCFDTLNSSLSNSNVEWFISSFPHCQAQASNTAELDHKFDS